MKKVFKMIASTIIIMLTVAGCGVQVAVTPKEMTEFSKDWPLPNRDYSNTRATADSSINSSSISALNIEWVFDIPGTSEWGAAATNPIILGNVVYFSDLKSNVYAVDALTGKLIWDKKYDLDNIGPNGVVVGDEKIFATLGAGQVACLDMKGNELWKVALGKTKTEGIDIQPVVYDGLVYVSTVPGTSGKDFYTGGGAGVLYALDTNNGNIVWSFDTVDSKDIWGNPQVNSGGGSWYPPAIDTETGLIFWGIANPAPWPGTKEFPNGSSRKGDNLYTNSMVAIDHASGKLVWYNQVLKHDIFDYDLMISPILATINIGGTEKKVVFGAGKLGKVFAFDRADGKIVWEKAVGLHKNDTLTELPPGITKVSPGPLGGVETPMAISDGVIYVPIVNMPVEYTPTELVPSSFNLSSGKGELVALNANNGAEIWKADFNTLNVGAATVVNDVVFTATNDGWVYGFDKKSGAQLWKIKAPAGINGWPAVKNDMIIWPAGYGKNPVLICIKLGAAGLKTSIKIISPTESATLNSGDVEVKVSVTRFNLVEKLGKPKVAGEGHIHYYMDVEPPTKGGEPAITAKGTFAPSAESYFKWKDVKPGMHTFYAQLVNNDHTPVESTAIAKVTVDVKAQNNSSIQSTNEVTVIIKASNMAFDLKEITVPKGAKVTLVFENNDGNIPHNVAFYEAPDAKKIIFVGDVITNTTITQSFMAPSVAGAYFFRCDVHPLTMTGKFIVK